MTAHRIVEDGSTEDRTSGFMRQRFHCEAADCDLSGTVTLRTPELVATFIQDIDRLHRERKESEAQVSG